jgi:hypothetical protein
VYSTHIENTGGSSMKVPFVLAFVAATLLLPATSAAASGPPHPAPLGPQRPYEPAVPGPANIDSGTAAVNRLGAGVTVTFDGHRTTTTGEKPAAPREFAFLFDNTIRFHPYAFPTCTRAEVVAATCPRGAQVGTGRATFFPTGTADVVVYNTRFPNGMRGVLITIPATGTILDNTLEPVVGSYQRKYDWALHEIIQPDSTPPAERGSTTAFLVTFGATWQGHDFVTTTVPANRALNLGVWSHYVTGQKTLTEGTTNSPS